MQDDDDVDEALVQAVASTLSNMSREERNELAELMGITAEEYDRVVANWRRTRS